MEYIIEASNITKTFSDHKALDEVNIKIPKGAIYGLLGPNGAGKTTFIRLINQITKPDNGVILYNGEPLNENHISKIGYLPEERGLYKKNENWGTSSLFSPIKRNEFKRCKKQTSLLV